MKRLVLKLKTPSFIKLASAFSMFLFGALLLFSSGINANAYNAGPLGSLYQDDIVLQDDGVTIYLTDGAQDALCVDFDNETIYFNEDQRVIEDLEFAFVLTNVYASGKNFVYVETGNNYGGYYLPSEYEKMYAACGDSDFFRDMNEYGTIGFSIDGGYNLNTTIELENDYRCLVKNANTDWLELDSELDNGIRFRFHENVLDHTYYNNFGVVNQAAFFKHYSNDTVAPTFDTNTSVHFISNYDNPLSLDYIKSALKATDETDGNVSSSIKIESTNYNLVNNRINLGTYEVLASSSDSAGNKSYASYYVDVVDIAPPSVQVSTFTAYNNKLTSTNDIISAALTVSDNYYTNFTFNVISDNYTSNYGKAGNYQIVVEVVEGSSNKTTVSIPVNNVDAINPTFTKTTDKIAWDNSKAITKEQILSYFAATDESGSTRLDINEDQNDYFANWKVARNYTFEIIAYDEADNEVIHNVTLEVKDVTSPTLTTTTASYTTNYLTPISIESIIANCVALDESNNNPTISIVSDGYSDNKNTVGSYSIVLNSFDGVNYSNELVITVTVIDDVKPTASGPKHLYASNLENGTLTKEQILSYYVFSDKSEYTVELIDQGNYFEKQSIVGDYSLQINVKDEFGNETILPGITLTVNDKQAPVLSVEDYSYVIMVDVGEKLTHDQVLALLVQLNIIDSVDEVVAVTCLYFDSTEAGEFELEVEMLSGERRVLQLNAVGDAKVEEPKEKGFIAKVGDFFVNGFKDLIKLNFNAGSIVIGILLLGVVIVIVYFATKKDKK